MFAKALMAGLVGAITTGLLSSFVGVSREIANGIGNWVGVVVLNFTFQQTPPRAIAGLVFRFAHFLRFSHCASTHLSSSRLRCSIASSMRRSSCERVMALVAPPVRCLKMNMVAETAAASTATDA